MMNYNLPNEVPNYVYSVRLSRSCVSRPGDWTIDEIEILESSDTWIVVRQTEAPGLTKLDRLELDLDGVTVAGDRLFYATLERARKFIDRGKDSLS